MTIDITQVLTAFIGLLAAALTAFVIPWLKAKSGAQKWEQLLQIATVAVAAAEQMGAANLLDEGVKKLDYAMARVKGAMAKQGLSYDENTVRAAVEAAVLALKG